MSTKEHGLDCLKSHWNAGSHVHAFHSFYFSLPTRVASLISVNGTSGTTSLPLVVCLHKTGIHLVCRLLKWTNHAHELRKIKYSQRFLVHWTWMSPIWHGTKRHSFPWCFEFLDNLLLKQLNFSQVAQVSSPLDLLLRFVNRQNWAISWTTYVTSFFCCVFQSMSIAITQANWKN